VEVGRTGVKRLGKTFSFFSLFVAVCRGPIAYDFQEWIFWIQPNLSSFDECFGGWVD